MHLPDACLNSSLSTEDRPVWLVEAVPCAPGEVFEVVFETIEPRWRQGVWLGSDGELETASTTTSQIVLWSDAPPTRARVRVSRTTDGLLRLYNVWDSGRGRRMESQAHTSGMLREDLKQGYRYRCSDINPRPTFEALVFRLERVEQHSG